jgi:hypothetical protein
MKANKSRFLTVLLAVLLVACGGGGGGGGSSQTNDAANPTAPVIVPRTLISTARVPTDGNAVLKTYSDNSTELVFYKAGTQTTVSTDSKGMVSSNSINSISTTRTNLAGSNAYEVKYQFSNGYVNTVTYTDVTKDSIYELDTDISRINDYSQYTKFGDATKYNPESICDYPKKTIIYPSSYIGKYQLPTINSTPLKAGVVKAVAITDSWGEMNYGCGGRTELENLDETFKRLKSIGVEYVTYGITYGYSYDGANWKVYSPYEFGLQNRDDFINMNAIAAKYGIKTEWFSQFMEWDAVAKTWAPIKQYSTSTEMKGFLEAYEIYLLDLANFLDKNKVAGLHIDCNCAGFNFNANPSSQQIYIDFLKRIAPKIRSIYSGNIVLASPLENYDKVSDEPLIAKNVNSFFISFAVSPDLYENRIDTFNISDVKNWMNQKILPKLNINNPYQVPLALHFAVGSRMDNTVFYDTGFCLSSNNSTNPSNNNSCFQRNIQPNFSYQAIVYEGIFEWFSDLKSVTFNRIQTIDYSHIDQLIPTNWFPALDGSIRNKPAELIVKSWYLAK